MIRISQIDDKFSIYKENTVVLLGIGAGTKQIMDLLKYHGIEIAYICDSNKDNFGKVLDGVPVISPAHLQELVKKSSKGVMVQISINNIAKDMEDKLFAIGVKAVVSFMEAWQVLNFMNKVEFLKLNPYMIQFSDNLSIKTRILNNVPQTFKYIYMNLHLKEFLFIISIPKTGDNTLINTLKNCNTQHYMGLHTPEILNKELIKNIKQKVKIIVGFREPIAQNLSFLYHTIAGLDNTSASYHLKLDVKTFFKDGGDAQFLFNLAYDNDEKYEDIVPREASSFFINDWFERFKENILDLSQYPFDKENGYTIIKEGNLEIFVYQLERMNEIVNEMSDWIGQNSFDKWVMGNQANDKWIAN